MALHQIGPTISLRATIQAADEGFAVVDSLQVGSHFSHNMRLRNDVWTH
jgi:hypothetical protein